jgi:hypothetical protein
MFGTINVSSNIKTMTRPIAKFPLLLKCHPYKILLYLVLEIIIKRSRTLKIISKYPIEFQLIDIFL